MRLTNTRKALKKFAKSVLKSSASNLKAEKMGGSDLIKNLGFTVYQKKKKKKILEMVDFTFGSSKNYWQYVDEGVRGSGGYKGSGLARAAGSPFRFRSKNIARGVIAKWIKSKGISLRGADGRFKAKTEQNIKSAAFVIGRAIAQRGLTRTQFFTAAYNLQLKKHKKKIYIAFGKDVEKELEQIETNK